MVLISKQSGWGLRVWDQVCFKKRHLGREQGCQMVCFQTKNSNLGKFRRALELKMLLYFMTIWNILRPFGIIYGRLV
jgi:hypothetical protein